MLGLPSSSWEEFSKVHFAPTVAFNFARFKSGWLQHVEHSARKSVQNAQTRRQEMKLGGGVHFVKKKWTLPTQNETKLNQTLLFYFTFHLFGGCVRTTCLRAWRITDLDNLKHRSRTEWAKLRHVIIAAAVCQWRRCLSACVRAGSGHFEHCF